MKDKNGKKWSAVSCLIPLDDKKKLDEVLDKAGMKQKEFVARVIRMAHDDINEIAIKLQKYA